jgi:lipoprotein-anchoring transpeptidase ErfK/SrfK
VLHPLSALPQSRSLALPPAAGASRAGGDQPADSATASDAGADGADGGRPLPGGPSPTYPVLHPGDAGAAVALLQVELTNREFSSGPVDGRFGPLLEAALIDFERSADLPPDGVAGPDVWRALEIVPERIPGAAYRRIAVTPNDTTGLAELPRGWDARAGRPDLPYGSVLERLAERHQASADYLRDLNPGVGWPDPFPGTPLRVPAVDFETVVEVALPYRKPRGLLAAAAPVALIDPLAAAESLAVTRARERTADSLAILRADSAIGVLRGRWQRRGPPAVEVRISTLQRVVRVYERGRLVARYPATVGSRQFPNPQGDWRIASQVFAPDYRFDESFLATGVRSERSVRVPPGPNNIVGLVWMGLDKPGFGLHGTDEPETIGAAASHGCVRLTNWDAERLARRVGIGTPVTIGR